MEPGTLHHEEHRAGGWTFRVYALVGRSGKAEDAWRVVSGQIGTHPLDVAAVFDGVGGHPHGREAAWSAAESLHDSLRHADGAEELLATMNQIVSATGGATTATILAFDRSAEPFHFLASVGDSQAFTLDAFGRMRAMAPLDHDGLGLTDHLGNPNLRGHTLPVTLAEGAPVLLCTDGFHRHVDPESLKHVLRSPAGARVAALELLLDEVRNRGLPDDATLILATRDG